MADDQDDDLSDVIVVKHVRRRSLPRPAPRKRSHVPSNGNAKHSPPHRKAQQDDTQDAPKRRRYGLRPRNLKTTQDHGPAHMRGEEVVDNTYTDQAAVVHHGRMTTPPDGRRLHNKQDKTDCDQSQHRQAGLEQDDPECAYCLEPLSSAERLVLRACSHELHRACFDLFPGNTATCCVCNQKSEELIVIDYRGAMTR
ncbi:hypothetical protein AC578_7060 [Pseudocercospora eumusae]|uniref:RING-type domain-containing protein n=1 Tax=Pseudocercospora eumusae TaxID=321146 RepID=A0A139HFV0_9PEZI|nr:hypothetical protein AC578_7060 [Pseudocercospora eumusae]